MVTNVHSSFTIDFDIALTQDSPYSKSLYWINDAGAAVNLTNKQLIWTIDFSGERTIKYPTTTDAAGGKIDLSLLEFEVDQIGLNADSAVGSHKLVARDTISGIYYRLFTGEVIYQGDIGGEGEAPEGGSALIPTIDVKSFGAIGDGVNNDTAAFNAAIAAANAKGGNDRPNIIGTTIFIPDGRYKITEALNPVTVSSVEFVGASKAATVLLLSGTGHTFTFGDATMSNVVVGGGMRDVKIEYLSAPTGTACVFNVDYAFSLTFDNIHIHNIGRLIQLGASSSRIAGGVRLSNIQGSVNNSGMPMIDVRYGAGLTVSNVQAFVSGVLAPVHPASMTTVAGTNVFNCFVGFWDVIQITGCIFERFDIGMAIQPTSGNVYQNIYMSNTIFDYLKRYCIYAEATAGATIAEIRADSSCWFVSWEDSAIVLTGAGSNDFHNISGIIPIAGRAGIYYNLPNAGDNIFSGLQFVNCNRLGDALAAMTFIASSKGFTVMGCSGNRSASWQAPYGIHIAAGCSNYVQSLNRMNGSIDDILIV